MQYLKRHGVKHVEVEHIKRSKSGEWDLDELKRLRDLADKNGFTINMLNFKRIRSGELLVTIGNIPRLEWFQTHPNGKSWLMSQVCSVIRNIMR